MTTPFLLFAALIALCTLAAVTGPRKGVRQAPMRAAEAHAMTQPSINYAGNPYRIGAYVYVMEDNTPSEHDWQGTFIGMSHGMALIRDQETHVVAHVNRDQLYSAQR